MEVVIIPDTPRDSGNDVVVVTFKLRRCWLSKLDELRNRLRVSRSDLIRAGLYAVISDAWCGWIDRERLLELASRMDRCAEAERLEQC